MIFWGRILLYAGVGLALVGLLFDVSSLVTPLGVVMAGVGLSMAVWSLDRRKRRARAVVHFALASWTRTACGQIRQHGQVITIIPSHTTCPYCLMQPGINWALPIALREEARPFA